MDTLIRFLTRIGDKISSLGALVSAMGCAMCFPAIASLGSAVGLGFLSQWEGLLVNTLLPLFAWIALVLNGLGWFSHRQWQRSLLGMTGPILLLLSLYPWFRLLCHLLGIGVDGFGISLGYFFTRQQALRR